MDICIQHFSNKILKKEGKEAENDSTENESETEYITLPYIGNYSKVAKNKINKLFKM